MGASKKAFMEAQEQNPELTFEEWYQQYVMEMEYRSEEGLDGYMELEEKIYKKTKTK